MLPFCDAVVCLRQRRLLFDFNEAVIVFGVQHWVTNFGNHLHVVFAEWTHKSFPCDGCNMTASIESNENQECKNVLISMPYERETKLWKIVQRLLWVGWTSSCVWLVNGQFYSSDTNWQISFIHHHFDLIRSGHERCEITASLIGQETLETHAKCRKNGSIRRGDQAGHSFYSWLE